MSSPLVVVLGAGRPFSGTEPSALQRTSGDRRVLDWLLDAFREGLVDPEIHFVGGYRMEDIVDEYPEIHFSRNEDWEETGTLGSLLSAPIDEGRPTYVCYADVVFEPDVVARLAAGSAENAVAIDRKWLTRYQSRSEESQRRAEKVRLDDERISHIDADLDTESADAEFIGLARLSPIAVETMFSLVDRGVVDANSNLPELTNALLDNGLNIDAVDVEGQWAELETAADLSRFVLGTKANTLRRLESMVTESRIAPQYTFTAGEFEHEPDSVRREVRAELDASKVIVRSSAIDEDGWDHSNAGRFESVLDVPIDDDEALTTAIETVLSSYDGRPDDQVLIQPMVENVAASGVVMTRSMEHASPYYVINYDASTGSTVTVTDGSGDEIRTAIVRKDSVSTDERSVSVANAGIPIQSIIDAVRELESVIGHDGLDVEFAITEDGTVYVLQVRPMTVDPGERTVDDDAVIGAVDAARETFQASQGESPFVLGNRTVYGVMPDWNPAEIIGRTPRRLASSLYRYLIMDEVWARQRAEFGYRDVRPQPLMRSFAGQPYVDVRAVFNSFIPAGLPDELATDLVDHYLTRLEENPHLHDKVEFEIAITCLPFDFEYRAEPLVEAGFSSADLEQLETELGAITRGAFDRFESGRDLEDIDTLEDRFERIVEADLPPLRAARYLLEDCRRLGTLPFAHLARTAFVAVSLLRSLERKEIIEDGDTSRFLNSLDTVAREFEQDGYRVSAGDLEWERFVETYGHLRPGTYDITSPAYASDPEGYLQPTVETASKPSTHPDPRELWDETTRAAIESELAEIGLPADCERFIDFLEGAIEGREYSKFVFSKNLSEALECIASFGANYDLSRKELSHVTIEEILELTTDHPPSRPTEWLEPHIRDGRSHHTVAQAVELPPLLYDERDFLGFERPAREPNFVTTETVRAEPVGVDDDEATLDGRLVMIPQADPGYDWLFGYDIAGLITMYGGTNSHMAIRAAEFGLPAAIGVGESLYEQLTGADLVELDCEAKTVERIR
jgi:choline kinase